MNLLLRYAQNRTFLRSFDLKSIIESTFDFRQERDTLWLVRPFSGHLLLTTRNLLSRFFSGG